MNNYTEILHELTKGKSENDKELITKAWKFAQEAHDGILRASGEPYFSHAANTALILLPLNSSATVLIAGLLHDSVDNGNKTLEDIEVNFGSDIRTIVSGVMELGKLKYQGMTRHAEALRKLFIIVSKDLRVILVKFANRIHNMRTIKHIASEDKKKRIALETLELYAPLANRLGIGSVKSEFESLAFPIAYPREYAKVIAEYDSLVKRGEATLTKIHRSLAKHLAIEGIKVFSIDHRVKGAYSFYKKMEKKGDDTKIFDVLALRVLLTQKNDCYQALGILHKLWQPVPGQIDDYVSNPKPNGYQSIHTTIFTGDGDMVEVQIRTVDMHRVAEHGVASHVAYDESGKPKEGGKLHSKVAWVQKLIEASEHEDQIEIAQTLEEELLHERIFCFTPKGAAIELPLGATPIDFAYAIHSDIGNHASGATINGKYSSLDTKLMGNESVEIQTSKKNRPNRKWLDFVVTSEAKRKIRSYLKNTKQ